MADLLTSSQKAKFEGVFDDIHDTFSRTIFVYKIFNKRFVGINMNKDYNGLYDQALNDNESGTAIDGIEQVRKIETKARVLYSSNQKEQEDSSTGQQTSLNFPLGSIRLKLSYEAFELIRDAKEVEVDGELFNLETDASKAGMFSPRYYVVFLKKIQ